MPWTLRTMSTVPERHLACAEVANLCCRTSAARPMAQLKRSTVQRPQKGTLLTASQLWLCRQRGLSQRQASKLSNWCSSHRASSTSSRSTPAQEVLVCHHSQQKPLNTSVLFQ
jgi:hypothetical protein